MFIIKQLSSFLYLFFTPNQKPLLGYKKYGSEQEFHMKNFPLFRKLRDGPFK